MAYYVVWAKVEPSIGHCLSIKRNRVMTFFVPLFGAAQADSMVTLIAREYL